jgi:hypothetical protein
MAYKSSSDPDSPRFNKCPTPEEVIDQYLKRKNPRIPKGAPADGFQFARWWMAHQIPSDNFTEPAVPPSKKGGEWETPYHDRLLYTLRRFLRLKAVQQVYVIEHINKGVPYKGDDLDKYIQFVEENTKKEKAKAEGRFDEYVDNAFISMRKALRRMTYGHDDTGKQPGEHSGEPAPDPGRQRSD